MFNKNRVFLSFFSRVFEKFSKDLIFKKDKIGFRLNQLKQSKARNFISIELR